VGGPGSELRYPVNDVADQVKTIEVVKHLHDPPGRRPDLLPPLDGIVTEIVENLEAALDRFPRSGCGATMQTGDSESSIQGRPATQRARCALV
jgi:hypothetical protein